ncbi:hypothetical protein ACSFCH_13925, partial [Enterococcus faecalis]
KIKDTRPWGMSFPKPLEPPPAEMDRRYRFLFHSAMGFHNLTRPFRYQSPYRLHYRSSNVF